MSFTLVFTDQYNRRAARFLKRHPQVREQYRKTLLLLMANPHHPSLRLHALGGKLEGLHSVSINLSYRITLELIIRDQQIVPINVGDHDAVY
ncbi:plasmid stabilization protein [Rhodanobacter sp. Root480]|jgi:mRNA-degrading endonuclease YafQ of YafQ-DinJ toxin-antitoxin module|uniref:type II toxin-antitoxin system RelE/ParE family toxin n=1 Tax=Rhodanobacter sp. Root480 TaxID=1736542 RepID=UPI0006FCD038|nr:plasmid stabilization protein [Rhodanobacter sp. Root480]KQX99529.1 plasmid stabilization protein [Rhodanobacter sp. Root480]